MIRRAWLAKPALAAALALLLAAEWLLPSPAVPPVHKPTAIPTAIANAAAGSTSDDTIHEWGEATLARPLFNQDRRPIRQPGTQISEALPRLSAIIIIGSARRAIFATDGQKPQLVAEGGEIGAYRLKIVTPEKVDLLGPNGLITMQPQFIAPALAAQVSPR